MSLNKGLGQFYTQQAISNLLVSQIFNTEPKTIIELSAGNGSLVTAATQRWSNASIIAVDIDRKNIAELRKSHPNCNSYHLNALNNQLYKKTNIDSANVDIAIGNPPFLSILPNKKILSILSKAGLDKCFKPNNKISTELVFLAQNLQLLRTGGELAIILPDGLLTGHNHQLLRENLIKTHNVRCIIQLPDNVFTNTEARTHILVLEKNGINKDQKVTLLKADELGNLSNKIYISFEEAIQRLDYDFYSWKQSTNFGTRTILKHFTGNITRGNVNATALKKLGVTQYIHTSSFNHKKGIEVSQTAPNKYTHPYKTAVAGDILVPRVGKRCLSGSILITQGEHIITDTVLRIRAPKEHIDKIWTSISSSKGADWRVAHAHGVCAQVLSKTDLLQFPIEI